MPPKWYGAPVTAGGASDAATMRRRALLWWLLVATALALARQGNAQFARIGAPSAGLPWWVGALGVLGLAACLFDFDQPARADTRWRLSDWVGLTIVIALALLTRLWRIGSYPPSDAFGFEEFQTGIVAYGVFKGWQFPWEFPLTNISPALTYYLIGLNAWGLRTPFIVGGIVAPALLFLGLRRLVALPAAFAAAALLASARWPAASARFADEVFFPIWVVALAGWLFVRGIQRGRQLDVLFGAVIASDLFYAYTAYRAIPIAAMAMSVLILVVRWWYGHRDAGALRHIVLVVVVWIILIMPGIISGGSLGSSVFAEALNRHAAERGTVSMLDRATHMWKMIRTGVDVFITEGDTMATVNIPGEPMLDPITGPLALLSVLLALWHWRQPWRAVTLVVVMLTFAGISFFPNNLYVGRYFVLLVPLFALIAFALDDVMRWRRAPRWTAIACVIAALGVAAYNVYWLQRLVDDPAVRASFLVPENTVVAEVHDAPLGARVVLMSVDAFNALEPSDYTWYTTGRVGGRPTSLAAALTVDPTEKRPIRWIIQGEPESQLLPKLVQLVCQNGVWRMRAGINPMAVVGSVQVASPRDCVSLPAAGLSATYSLERDKGMEVERQIDPALMVHTIPSSISWPLRSRKARTLDITWHGELDAPAPGSYRIQLDLVNARGSITVGSTRAEIRTGTEDQWQSANVSLDAKDATVPIRVELHSEAGLGPAVRLWWQPPGGRLELIPPQVLRPR